MPDEPGDILLNRLRSDYAAALGSAIAAWAYFEFRIDELIWELARVEQDVGACLTSNYGTVAQKFDALFAIARLVKVDEKHLNQLKKIRLKADGHAQSRNRIVHDPWFFGSESRIHYRLQKTAKSRLDFSFKPVSIEHLKTLEREFVALTHSFDAWRHEVLQEFYALPQTSQ